MAEQQQGGTGLSVREPGGTGAQAVQMANRAKDIWEAMPVARRNRLLSIAIVLLGVVSLLVWWGTRTDWKTLYGGLEARDLQQVEGELSSAGVTYRATDDGSGVEVPAELLDKARMAVAAKGMPQSGRMGFELFDKPNWVGSEFDEQVNYQRALEGELEHTIATLSAVRSARVHLVLSKESLFTDQQQPAKASVVLKLKQGRLSRDEMESIRNLVAGSVQGLSPEQVTLVDADGKINLNTPDDSMQASNEEQGLSEKLVAMLEPLAGRENVRATVNIRYDQSTQQRTDEVVDPNQVVALQTQKSTQQSGTVVKPQGVPGTVSNTPSAADATGKAQMPVYPQALPQQQNSQEESSTFAVTKHTLHEEIGPGRVQRITAAVLINDRPVVEGQGAHQTVVWRPRTTDEMHRLEDLARAAVGFDQTRGDSVVLQNISFSANSPEVPLTGWEKTRSMAKDVLRSQPELLRDIGFGAIALLTVLFVVRPVIQSLLRSFEREQEATARVSLMPEERLLDLGQDTVQLGVGDAAARRLPELESVVAAKKAAAAIDSEGVLEYVAAHVRRDPQESTRLLEAWIGTGKESLS
ncbi:MAG: flagellar basal-body MS-ring/collar protein FliF [Acidobacteriaceae bacterium]|nr:flagellar basal-body MS-ring/collar protein FliF [Acidobacteriaceae bacterium]